MGSHEFKYAVFPHTGTVSRIIKVSNVYLHAKFNYRFNNCTFLGSFQDSGLIRHSYNFNNEIKVVPTNIDISRSKFNLVVFLVNVFCLDKTTNRAACAITNDNIERDYSLL